MRLHKSPHLSALGYAVSAISNEQTGARSSHLLDLFRYIVLVSEQQGSLPTDQRLSNLLCALHLEAYRWYPTQEIAGQRPQLLRDMLTVINLVRQAVPASNIPRVLLVVTLTLNRDATSSFGGVAKYFFRCDALATHAFLSKSADLLLVLSVTGILGALEKQHMLEEVQRSELESLFALLWAQPDYIRSSDSLTLGADNNITVGRCIHETVFACYQYLAKHEINIPEVDRIVGHGIRDAAEP